MFLILLHEFIPTHSNSNFEFSFSFSFFFLVNQAKVVVHQIKYDAPHI